MKNTLKLSPKTGLPIHKIAAGSRNEDLRCTSVLVQIVCACVVPVSVSAFWHLRDPLVDVHCAIFSGVQTCCHVFFWSLCHHRAKCCCSACFFRSVLGFLVASTYLLQKRFSTHHQCGLCCSPPLCRPRGCSSLKALAPPLSPREFL